MSLEVAGTDLSLERGAGKAYPVGVFERLDVLWDSGGRSR